MLELLPDVSKAVDSVGISAVVVIEVLSEAVDSVKISAVVDSVSDELTFV